jgi:hypothetical protein
VSFKSRSNDCIYSGQMLYVTHHCATQDPLAISMPESVIAGISGFMGIGGAPAPCHHVEPSLFEPEFVVGFQVLMKYMFDFCRFY